MSKRRLPVIYQAESAECGLACVAMMSGYFGNDVDMHTMREHFQTSARGMSLNDLLRAADTRQLECHAMRLEIDDLGKLDSPCILHWRLQHFVVLERMKAGVAIIHDPASGRRKVKAKELSDCFTGIAIHVQPRSQADFGKSGHSLRVAKIVGPVQGAAKALVQVVALAITAEILGLALPLFVQLVTDQVLPYQDRPLLWALALTFVTFVGLQAAVSGVRGWAVVRISSGVYAAWAAGIFAKLVSLPEEYFKRRNLADIASRFGSIAIVQQTLTVRFFESLLDGAMALVMVGIMSAYSGKLALMTVGCVATYLLLRHLFHDKFREATIAQLNAESVQNSIFMESVRASTAIRLANKNALQCARFTTQLRTSASRAADVQRLSVIFGVLVQSTVATQTISTLLIGGLDVLDNAMSIGALMAFLVYSATFTRRSMNCIDYLVSLRLLRSHAERIADIAQSQSERHVVGRAATPRGTRISLSGVGFRYSQSADWVFRDLDLEIQEGESVAIVGPSGSGKSTLAKIILGLYDASEGVVSIDGINIQALGKARLRDMLGVVMEDDDLLNGSISENICFFESDVDSAMVERAARRACIHEDIERLSMGYQTLVGDMGSTLSGGQKQRVLLARAFYRNPRILLLDEATSRLDIANEKLVNDSIKDLHMTRIVIAHRPETIAAAGRIIELRDGVIREVSRGVRHSVC